MGVILRGGGADLASTVPFPPKQASLAVHSTWDKVNLGGEARLVSIWALTSTGSRHRHLIVAKQRGMIVQLQRSNEVQKYFRVENNVKNVFVIFVTFINTHTINPPNVWLKMTYLMLSDSSPYVGYKKKHPLSVKTLKASFSFFQWAAVSQRAVCQIG